MVRKSHSIYFWNEADKFHLFLILIFQNYCINEEVQQLKYSNKINEKCLDLQKKKTGRILISNSCLLEVSYIKSYSLFNFENTWASNFLPKFVLSFLLGNNYWLTANHLWSRVSIADTDESLSSLSSEKSKKSKEEGEQPKKRRKKTTSSGCPYYSHKKFAEFKEYLLVSNKV